MSLSCGIACLIRNLKVEKKNPSCSRLSLVTLSIMSPPTLPYSLAFHVFFFFFCAGNQSGRVSCEPHRAAQEQEECNSSQVISRRSIGLGIAQCGYGRQQGETVSIKVGFHVLLPCSETNMVGICFQKITWKKVQELDQRTSAPVV